MTTARFEARTFDALRGADLEQVYLQGKEEMLRGRAFRILLAHADSIPKLETLAFEGERGLASWTTDELLEISNRFRLLSSPENEIRLYRQCQDEIFRASARVREFYILALNRVGHAAEAIQEALAMIAAGGHNALIWGMLGESYSARMMFAEQLAAALQTTTTTALDSGLLSQLPHYFPELSAEQLSLTLVERLRLENLRAAERIFQQGFRETGASFPGLGWMFRTLDQQVDLMRAYVRQLTTADASASLDALRRCEASLDAQAQLIAVALELQGGSESLDYWTHAGAVQLAVLRADAESLKGSLARANASADAGFKFGITLRELGRIRAQLEQLRHLAQRTQRAGHTLDAQIECAHQAIAALKQGQTQFGGRATADGHAAARPNRPTPFNALDWMLRKTINFRALTGNLVPLYIAGSIGRVGARVPDLMINRRVREDLLDLLEDKVVQALPPHERDQPLAVVARIQAVVGTELRLEALQDLQSPAHAEFDTRSDGLIALSGVDLDMRKDSRTSTDLTAALLMQTGDCRETMYLNGALFACWQQREALKHIANAMLCLELGYTDGFEHIVHERLPALLRYQLRGGQAALFVESIAMLGKYRCRQAADPAASSIAGIALLRPYGLAELRAGQPMSRYELENAVIEVSYVDGATRCIDCIDPDTGRWQPIPHRPGVDGGGVPIIPDAGENFERVQAIRLLNLVEDHAMTFLYDSQEQRISLCDGFYNEVLFASPYPFAFRQIALEAAHNIDLIQVAERALIDEHYLLGEAWHANGSDQRPSSAPLGSDALKSSPVYLRFLPFSHTDYAVGLVEGDLPGRLQLMGRTFHADYKLERRRIEEGRSPIPAVLEDIQVWQMRRSQSPSAERDTLDRQLARLMLDLAKAHPELVQFRELEADQILIRERVANEHVYLVLGGQLHVTRNGSPLLGKTGVAQTIGAGAVVGEISALSGGPASATVRGNAVVLGISKQVIQQQLDAHPTLRQSMEALASSRMP